MSKDIAASSDSRSMQDLLAAGSVKLVYRDSRQLTGRIEGLDGSLRVQSSMSMERIRANLPCFTPATRIAVPAGWRRVGDLQAGDKIITRDVSTAVLAGVECREFGWRELGLNPLLRPIRIRAGALGGGVPERDIVVSPNQRIFTERPGSGDGMTRLPVPARHLVGRRGIEVISLSSVTYVQLQFDRSVAVLAEGCWSEIRGRRPASDSASRALPSGATGQGTTFLYM